MTDTLRPGDSPRIGGAPRGQVDRVGGVGRIGGIGALARAVSRHAEMVALAGIVLLAAAARLVNLPNRAGFDMDQGLQAKAIYDVASTHQLPTFGPPMLTVGNVHHGALYYDLLAPAAWLGGGDPVAMYLEIALLNLLCIPIVWWVARCIGGPRAGLTAALLAALSTALVRYSIGIWNPFLLGPGACLAMLGTYMAWRSGHGRWWLVAALGVDVAAQAHIAASLIAIPVLAAYLLAVARDDRASRRRLLGWGVASVAVVVVTLLPLIVEEIGNGFPELRGIVGYLVLGHSSVAAEVTRTTPKDLPMLVRLPIAVIRVLAWPVTGWPLIGSISTFLPACVAAAVLVFGLLSRVIAVRRGASLDEKRGVYLIAGSLAVLALIMGVALKDVSQIQGLPTEQYHAVADPFVIVAAAIVLSSIAGARMVLRGRRVGPAVYAIVLAGFAVWNVAWWPPIDAPDGGWPAVTSATRQIEEVAAGRTIGLASLPSAKTPDAYRYPLMLDRAALTEPATAEVVVLVCDTLWVEGCGGRAEEAWRNANGSDELRAVKSFRAAPERIVTIYERRR